MNGIIVSSMKAFNFIKNDPYNFLKLCGLAFAVALTVSGFLFTSLTFIQFLSGPGLDEPFLDNRDRNLIYAIFIVTGTWMVIKDLVSGNYNEKGIVTISKIFGGIVLSLTFVSACILLTILMIIGPEEYSADHAMSYYSFSWVLVIILVSLKLYILMSVIRASRKDWHNITGVEYAGFITVSVFLLAGIVYSSKSDFEMLLLFFKHAVAINLSLLLGDIFVISLSVALLFKIKFIQLIKFVIAVYLILPVLFVIRFVLR